MQKKTQLCVKRHLKEQIFRRQISTRPELKRLLLAASTVLVCEIARETEKNKKKKRRRRRRSDGLCIEPVSRQNKSRPAPFRALIACANEAEVTDLRNYTNNKSM